MLQSGAVPVCRRVHHTAVPDCTVLLQRVMTEAAVTRREKMASKMSVQQTPTRMMQRCLPWSQRHLTWNSSFSPVCSAQDNKRSTQQGQLFSSWQVSEQKVKAVTFSTFQRQQRCQSSWRCMHNAVSPHCCWCGAHTQKQRASGLVHPRNQMLKKTHRYKVNWLTAAQRLISSVRWSKIMKQYTC